MFRKKLSIVYRTLVLKENGVYAEVVITPPKEGHIRIIGPDAKVAYDVKKGQSLFKIFELRRTPLGGPYAFIFESKHGSCEQRVKFYGGKTEIAGSALMKERYEKGGISYEAFIGVRLKISNKGDLPIFLDRCTAELDSRHLDVKSNQLFLMPGKNGEVLVTFEGRQGKRIRLSIFNEQGKEMLEFTELLSPS